MRLQMRVEGIGGELHEVGGQPQALKLTLAIVTRIRHGGSSKQEAYFCTLTRSLSVVQTTEAEHQSGRLEL
jgi:hypothetical protein